MQPLPKRKQAVVIGGSMAGLLSARVLADHFDEVTIFERDRFPENVATRKGLPQAQHIHVLLDSGRRVLERLFPELIPDLVSAGAANFDAVQDMKWISPGGHCPQFTSDLRMVGATRDLIDWCVRQQLQSLDGIKIQDQTAVASLSATTSGDRVTGVLVDDANYESSKLVNADLVVDATGRGSRAPQWLNTLGYDAPEETIVNGFLGYASRFVERPADWKEDWSVYYIQCAPPSRKRGGVILEVEDHRWIVTLAGGGKDYPPRDEEGFRQFARSLPDRSFADAYEAARPVSDIVVTRSTENRLRHYERLSRFPKGLIVTGDAACTFNPVYGQGMTVAALAAVVLEECLRDRNDANLARRFQTQLARQNARPWLLATSEDYRYAEVEGAPASRITRGMHAYFDRVTAVATTTPWIHQRMVEVLHLRRSPLSLFAPGIVIKAITSSRTDHLGS